MQHCIEFWKIILEDVGIYLRFKLVNFVLINIEHVNFLHFLSILFSGHITLLLDPNFPSLLNYKILLFESNLIGCTCISWWHLLVINYFILCHYIEFKIFKILNSSFKFKNFMETKTQVQRRNSNTSRAQSKRRERLK